MNRIKFILVLSIVLVMIITTVLTVLHLPTPIKEANAEDLKSEYYRCIIFNDDEATAECLDALAQRSYDQFEVKVITEVLDTLPYGAKNKWCHEMMHYLGWKSYTAQGAIADAFLESSELCDSGMYHGVMEEYLRKHGLGGNIEELIKDVCVTSLSNHPELSEGTEGLCYHGLGHGLMYVTSSDLRKSLDYCDVLEEYAEGCYSGVLMEYKQSKELGPLDNEENLDDFEHCFSLTLKQTNVCFFTQGLNYLSLANGRVKEAMEYCAKVPDAYRKNCYVGVGSNTPTPGRDHYSSGVACREALLVSEDAYYSCIEGGVSFTVQLERGNVEESMGFCEAAEEAYKPYCYGELGKKTTNWLTLGTSITDVCSVISDPAHRNACIARGE